MVKMVSENHTESVTARESLASAFVVAAALRFLDAKQIAKRSDASSRRPQTTMLLTVQSLGRSRSAEQVVGRSSGF